MTYHSWAEIQLPSNAFAYKKIQTSIIQTRACSVLFTHTWGAVEAGLRERWHSRPNVPSSQNNASITSHRWGLNAGLKSSRYSNAVKNEFHVFGCRVNPPFDETGGLTGGLVLVVCTYMRYAVRKEETLSGIKWGAMQRLNRILTKSGKTIKFCTQVYMNCFVCA